MRHLVSLCLLLALPAAAAEPSWPDLSHPPEGAAGSTADGSKDAALIVVIEDYIFVPEVTGARANGMDWYTWFQDTRGVGTVKALVDTDATREGILGAAEGIASRVRPGGILWVVFVGHGAPAPTGNDGLLVGVDAQQKASSIEARSVTRQELLAAVQGAQEQTVLVLDACFSGRTSQGGDLAPGLQPLNPISARVGGGATVLTAAGPDQYTGPLPGVSRPAFSYLVLGALWGWGDKDRDGLVTAREALDWTDDAMFRTIKDRKQTPSLEAQDEDLVLGRALEGVGKPDLAAIAMGGRGDDSATMNLGGGGDLARLAEAAREARQERLAAEEADAHLQAQLKAERDKRLDAAEAQLRDRADSDWVAVKDVILGGGPESVVVGQAYIDKYGDASVAIDGASREVTIAAASTAKRAVAAARQERQSASTSRGSAGRSTGGDPSGSTGGAPDSTCDQSGSLDSDDLINMLAVNVPTSIVVRTMKDSGRCWSTAEVARLQAAGAPDAVLSQARATQR